MKMLKGTLRETQYEMPSSASGNQPLKVRQTSLYNNDEVTYISDDVRTTGQPHLPLTPGRLAFTRSRTRA